jgi:hypothetical protein
VSFGPGQNNSPQVWLTIVGVVGDAKEYGLDRETRDELYTPLRQVGFGGNVILRTSAEPMSVLAACTRGIEGRGFTTGSGPR